MYKKSSFIILLIGIILSGCSNSDSRNSDAGSFPDTYKDTYNIPMLDVSPDIMDEIDNDLSGAVTDIEMVEDDMDVDSSFNISDVSVDTGDSDMIGDVNIPPELTGELIGFENVSVPQKGSIIFYNNWAMGDGKDSIEMISPDGSYKAVRLYAIRIWSFGVNRSGNIVVFSTNDPFQYERYGINVYDAIENTWLLKDNQPVVQITFGAINDECHTFVTDELLMMCRRANFRPDQQYMVVSDPYRILYHHLNNNKEEYLTPLDIRYNDYSGSIRGDGIILFNRNIIADRTIDIMTLDIKSGEVNLLLEDANSPVVSNDGEEVLFKKRGQNRLFLASAYNLNDAVAIIDGGNRSIGRYDFSPDKSRIAYTLEDRQNNCADLMIASRDGSSITKILDCSDEKKFITVIRWVYVE